MTGMNNLDYGIMAIVAIGGLYGLSRGALRMATSILSLIVGVAVASAWHERAGAIAHEHLGTGPVMSAALGYFVVFVAVAVAIEIAGRRIVALAAIVNLSWIDRLGGALFGAALAAIFAGVDLLILTTVLPADSRLLHDSQLAPRVIAYNQALLAYVPPEVKQLYQQRSDDLMRYWNEHKENPAGALKGATGGT
ncbi:MAG TPA: CvpA family protein [Candidatus Binataceae bacterium]|nr:CvpA family protein [Candidatus Binataceae bacterium]